MRQQSHLKAIALATFVSGTLDISFATGLTLYFGRDVPSMLRFVASGPFPSATEMGGAGAALGLVVHFMLMAIMATVYMLAASRVPDMLRKPIKWGVLYGLLTYAVLDLLVVPLRFGNFPPKPISIVTQLFAHIVLVGIVFALIARRTFLNRACVTE
jgi:hypothetical protein